MLLKSAYYTPNILVHCNTKNALKNMQMNHIMCCRTMLLSDLYTLMILLSTSCGANVYPMNSFGGRGVNAAILVVNLWYVHGGHKGSKRTQVGINTDRV